MITDDRVAAVTLTGSTGAGRAVAAIAGGALKKTVLELGGSDPFIVLADADLEAAAAWAARSRFQNTGQSCIAAKRIIVRSRSPTRLPSALLARVAELRVGDPTEAGVTDGPLARSGAGPTRVLLRAYGARPCLAEDAGAHRGGVRPSGADHSRRRHGRRGSARQRHPLGLGSNVWTSDLARGEALAVRLDAGHTAVNGMTTSDPRLPFGGVVVDTPAGRSGNRQTTIE